MPYIDELVQVSHNLAPTLSHNHGTRHFYAMQDANPGPRSPSCAIGGAESVMGLVEERSGSGRLVERDESTPCARRQVFAQTRYRAEFDRDTLGRSPKPRRCCRLGWDRRPAGRRFEEPSFFQPGVAPRPDRFAAARR